MPALPAYPDGSASAEGDLLRLARDLVASRHVGVLTTVDSAGAPHARWMATLTLDESPILLTLTDARSSKVRHIRENPRVDWLFASEDFSTALNIQGRARIHTDTVAIKRAWRAIEYKGHPYFLTTFDGKSSLAVIETCVERIDLTSPETGARRSLVLAATGSSPLP